MISIVITTQNRNEELRRALDSILLQTKIPDEVIVVDDCSRERVEISGYLNNLNIRLLRNEFITGVSHARNIGIQEAKGDWIAFLDDDDEFFPDKIECVLRVLSENSEKNIDVIFHAAEIFLVNEGISYIAGNRLVDCKNFFYENLLTKNIVGGTPLVIVKKNALLNVGMFDSKLKAFEDYELWIKLASAGYSFYQINHVLTKCNYTTKSVSVSKSVDANYEMFNKIYLKYIDDYNKLDKCKLLERDIFFMIT